VDRASCSIISNRVIGFDLDMTLVDSSRGIALALGTALREQGLNVDDAHIIAQVGLPLRNVIRTVAPTADVALAESTYRTVYPSIAVPVTQLLDGAIEALAAVHKRRGHVLILSAKFEAGVHAVLAHVGIKNVLTDSDKVVGGVFGTEKAELLRDSDAAAYVGDHPADVEAALYARSVPIAVATGAYDVKALQRSGATLVLNNLREFPKALYDLETLLTGKSDLDKSQLICQYW
jgi:phosphoglycolate phosphatase